MGKIGTGLLGGFSGKVGPVVGANWRGIEYMRHKGKKSNKPSTVAQQATRAKFGLVARMAGALKSLLLESYAAGSGPKTGVNLAIADMLATAVTGSYPGYALDYSKVPVSRGPLHMPNQPAAMATAGGNIEYSWQDNSGIVGAAATDLAVLVVYCASTRQAVILKGARQRSHGAGTLAVPNLTGKIVHTWLSFYSAGGRDWATGMYLGEVVVG